MVGALERELNNNMSRGYAVIKPIFWSGTTAKFIRGQPLLHTMVFYVMTCVDSRMTGVFRLPLSTIKRDLGLPIEEVEFALNSLQDHGFLKYDFEEEVIWVVNMAEHQVGESLSMGDKKRAAILSNLKDFINHPYVDDFIEKYGACYGACYDACHASLILISDLSDLKISEKSKKGAKSGGRIPDDFSLTAQTIEWCNQKCVVASEYMEEFCNYWQSKPGAMAVKLDWQKTFQNWVLQDLKRNGKPKTSPPSPANLFTGVIERKPLPQKIEVPIDQAALDRFLKDT